MKSPVRKPQKKRQLTGAEKSNIRLFHENNPLVTHTHIAAFFGVDRSTVSKILGQSSTYEPQRLEQPLTKQQQQQQQQQQRQQQDYFQPLHSQQPTSIQPPHQTLSRASPRQPSSPQSQIIEAAGLLASRSAYSNVFHNAHQNSLLQPSTPITKALKAWAQQQQREGKRITQAMIRQEAASLAAMTWRSSGLGGNQVLGQYDREQTSYEQPSYEQPTPINHHLESADVRGERVLNGSCVCGSVQNIPNADTSIANQHSNSPSCSSTWSDLDDLRNNFNEEWNAFLTNSSECHSVAEPSTPSGQFAFNPGVDMSQFDNVAMVSDQFSTSDSASMPSPPTGQACKTDIWSALNLIQTNLQRSPMDSFDFLCMEHLRERLSEEA